jgi:signal transduction histidine kinase
MAEAVETPSARPVKVLLVEDNHGDVVLAREAFRDANIPYSISVAGDGDEAMRMLRRQAPHAGEAVPDVILMDLNLPRRHGCEVIEEIGRDSAISGIPIVVLTSSEAYTEVVKGYDLSSSAYLVKPVNIEGVQRIVALIAKPPSAGKADPARSAAAAVEKELSDLTYIVSHDLSASLRHVSAFSVLLTRALGEDATSEQLAHCESIQQASKKCGRMLDGLLALSRVQQAPLTLQACDATHLMEVALLQLSAEVRSAGAEIDIDALGFPVIDSALMTLAFKHALSNAIKFGRPDAATKVHVRAREAPGAWAVQIADNGVGVALERQEKMFRLFYQDEAEGAYEGIGAGLTICRRILRRHGGDAHFVEAEQGACLEISVPADAAPPLQAHAK